LKRGTCTAGTEKYDVLIIGGGQAGIPLARDLAAMGKRVALAERKDLGGSCINFGCTPTKAAIASAKVAHLARRGAAYGLNIPTVDVDFLQVLQRARDISIEFRRGLDRRVDSTENLRLFRSHARFEGRESDGFRLRLGAEVVIADEVVIDTGTRSRIPAIEGLAEVQFIHAGNWLTMARLPTHLAMIGGGAIGLEMAQFFRRMGSRVTIIEGGDQVAGHEDADIGNALKTVLEAEGIEFRLKTSVTRIEADDGDLRLTLKGTGEATIEASHVFVATGRRRNTDDLGLEKVGVGVSAHGIIIEVAISGLSDNFKEQGNFGDAIAILEKAIKSTKKIPGHYYGELGLNYWLSDSFGAAIRNLDESWRINTESGNIISGILDLSTQGRIYTDVGELREAEWRLNTAYDLHKLLSGIYNNEHEFQEDYERILIYISRNLGDFYFATSVYQASNEIEKSERYYDESRKRADKLKDDEGLIVTYIDLGYVDLVKGKPDSAEDSFKKAEDEFKRVEGISFAEVEPNSEPNLSISRILGGKGRLAQMRGDFSKAEQQFEAAMRKAPNISGNAEQYLNLGNLYRATNKPILACSRWQKARELYEQIGMKLAFAYSIKLLNDNSCTAR